MKGKVWWRVAGAAVVALLVATIGAAAVLLDPNDYKQVLVDAVQNATGRTLVLNGPVRLTRSLWPTIEVNDVTLANLPGGTRPDMARAERIEVRLSLPALLQRQIEVARLTLIGPNILFEQVGGKPNWVFDPPGPAGGAVPAGAEHAFQLAHPLGPCAERHGDLASSGADQGRGRTLAGPAARHGPRAARCRCSPGLLGQPAVHHAGFGDPHGRHRRAMEHAATLSPRSTRLPRRRARWTSLGTTTCRSRPRRANCPSSNALLPDSCGCL